MCPCSSWYCACCAASSSRSRCVAVAVEPGRTPPSSSASGACSPRRSLSSESLSELSVVLYPPQDSGLPWEEDRSESESGDSESVSICSMVAHAVCSSSLACSLWSRIRVTSLRMRSSSMSRCLRRWMRFLRLAAPPPVRDGTVNISVGSIIRTQIQVATVGACMGSCCRDDASAWSTVRQRRVHIGM